MQREDCGERCDVAVSLYCPGVLSGLSSSLGLPGLQQTVVTVNLFLEVVLCCKKKKCITQNQVQIQ